MQISTGGKGHGGGGANGLMTDWMRPPPPSGGGGGSGSNGHGVLLGHGISSSNAGVASALSVSETGSVGGYGGGSGGSGYSSSSNSIVSLTGSSSTTHGPYGSRGHPSSAGGYPASGPRNTPHGAARRLGPHLSSYASSSIDGGGFPNTNGAVLAGGAGGHGSSSPSSSSYGGGPASRIFEYKVREGYAGLDFGHREGLVDGGGAGGDGGYSGYDRVVRGEYTVLLPDGRRQVSSEMNSDFAYRYRLR